MPTADPEGLRPEADVVVVGAGGAGVYTALTAARLGARVVLISPGPLAQTASYWAQVGIAAALALDATPELHFADTERAERRLVRHTDPALDRRHTVSVAGAGAPVFETWA